MAAGVYGASEGLNVLMVERSAAGGQAGTSSRIENYLGFPEGVSGEDLTGRALKQAIRFGAEIAMTRCIEKLTPASMAAIRSELDGGHAVTARAVLLATGVEWRRLQVEGDDRLLGRGVLYGASRAEANNVNGKKVFIVGGGNSAGQAAMFFSSYAAEVKVLVRGEGLKLTMSQYLIGEIASKANIEVIPFTEVVAVEGEEHLQRIVTRYGLLMGKETFVTYEADALFVMIGADANTTWMPAELERDPAGYICTGRDLKTWTRQARAISLGDEPTRRLLRRRRASWFHQARIQRSGRGQHGDCVYSPIPGVARRPRQPRNRTLDRRAVAHCNGSFHQARRAAAAGTAKISRKIGASSFTE